jgi:hypothetical protein
VTQGGRDFKEMGWNDGRCGSYLGNRQGFDSYRLGEAWARMRKRKQGREKGDASGGVSAALVKAAMSVRAARLSVIRGLQVRC